MIARLTKAMRRTEPPAIESTTYNGQEYRRFPRSKQLSQRRYYRRYLPKKEGGGVILLHRQVWIDSNGPIPSGFHVHHKRGYEHNKPEDLELEHGGSHIAKNHPGHLKTIQKYAGRGTLGVRIVRRMKKLRRAIGL